MTYPSYLSIVPKHRRLLRRSFYFNNESSHISNHCTFVFNNFNFISVVIRYISYYKYTSIFSRAKQDC